jgi:DNA-binding transcriptional ArsR family regulator
MQDRQIQAVSQFFKMLGDPTRLRIILELVDKGQNVSTLVKNLKAKHPTFSHHLSLLRMGGVIETKRSGKERFYSVRDFDKHGKTLRAILEIAVAMFKA